MSAPNADVTGWLVQLLGAERAATFTRPLTTHELVLIDERLAAHHGDPVAAMGADVDADTAAFIRALPIGVAR